MYQDIIDSPLDIKFSPPEAFLEDSALLAKEGADFVIMGGMYQGNKPWLASQVRHAYLDPMERAPSLMGRDLALLECQPKSPISLRESFEQVADCSKKSVSSNISS